MRTFGTIPVGWKIREEDLDQVKKTLGGLSSALPVVCVRALNRASTHMRTLMVRQVSAETGVSTRKVRKRLWAPRATLGDLRGKARAGAVPWPAILGGAVQTRFGVVTKASKELVRHSFMHTTKSGRTGVFIRTEESKYSVGKRKRGRLPIQEVMTRSATEVIRTTGGGPNAILLSGVAKLKERLMVEAALIVEGRRGA